MIKTLDKWTGLSSQKALLKEKLTQKSVFNEFQNKIEGDRRPKTQGPYFDEEYGAKPAKAL